MWRYNSIQFREFKHRINTEKLYFLTSEKNSTDTKEDILVAIDINLINMVNAFTNLVTDFIFSKIFEIFAIEDKS